MLVFLGAIACRPCPILSVRSSSTETFRIHLENTTMQCNKLVRASDGILRDATQVQSTDGKRHSIKDHSNIFQIFKIIQGIWLSQQREALRESQEEAPHSPATVSRQARGARNSWQEALQPRPLQKADFWLVSSRPGVSRFSWQGNGMSKTQLIWIETAGHWSIASQIFESCDSALSASTWPPRFVLPAAPI